jgi:hypothetical protein
MTHADALSMSLFRRILAISLLNPLYAGSTVAAAAEHCPPAAYSRAQLRELEARGFEIPDPAARATFARGLIACLASPDPWLRDTIAFEALSHLLRNRQLDAATQASLVDDVAPRLESPDPHGFERPFAALVLSELVRADRLQPYLTDVRRQELTQRSIAYFRGVRDYRGFDDREGWRHGIAHGADLLLQWALNPATDRAAMLQIRDAIGGQVAPAGHAYVHGESERLARPILAMAGRGVLSVDEWSEWFAMLVPKDADLFNSQRGLARRHDIQAFLQTAYVNAMLDEDAADDVLLPGLAAALKAMP